MVNKKTDLRTERDGLGEVQIPASAYWGAQTQRYKELYSISGQRPHPKLIDAVILVKKASALANAETGRLDTNIARTIAQVCDEILNGQWRDQFVADLFQTGSGASLNTNSNEVLANRGAELLGLTPGKYERIHPVNHVNLGQSTNDLFPSAMRVAILFSLRELEPVLLDLERLLRRKSLEFDKVAKVGRTHMQDSVPITLGQEFNAYGSSIERSVRRIKDASGSLLELNIGGTFVGTGFGAEPAFAAKVIEKLGQFTGFRFRTAEDLFRVTQSMADFVEFSSALKELAVELIKIAGDLRLLASGPRAGLAEITIPAIHLEAAELMPGNLPNKNNPYLVESISMVAFQVLGNDSVVTLCAQAGQLESNVMMPLLIHNALQALDLLRNSILAFNQRCLSGITANPARNQHWLDQSGASVSALSSYLGAERALAVLDEVLKSGKSVRQVVLEQKLMPTEILDRILHYKSLTKPGTIPIGGNAPSTTYSTNNPIE